MRTLPHLLGQLVVLQQRAHVGVVLPGDDGLHRRPVLAQPEVEVSEPEHLVEPGGDVGCDRKEHKRASEHLLDVRLEGGRCVNVVLLLVSTGTEDSYV